MLKDAYDHQTPSDKAHSISSILDHFFEQRWIYLMNHTNNVGFQGVQCCETLRRTTGNNLEASNQIKFNGQPNH